MALLAGTFLLTLEHERGEKMPQVTRPQISRVLRELLPRREWSRPDLLQWLGTTQAATPRLDGPMLNDAFRCSVNCRL